VRGRRAVAFTTLKIALSSALDDVKLLVSYYERQALRRDRKPVTPR